MKKVINPGYYSFDPSLNQIRFSGFGFIPENLYAVINVTTGKLVYAVASVSAGYGGTFSSTFFINDTLIYNSSNAGQAPSDLLQCIYDDPTAVQPVNIINGTLDTVSRVHDGSGNSIDSTTNPITGNLELNTNSISRVHDANQTPILSTVDLASLRDGLDTNMLTSSYGGQIDQVMPTPFSDYALSVGILSDGTLRAPKMNLNDQLEVDVTNSGNVPVSIMSSPGLTANITGPFGQGPMINSIPVTIANDQSAIPVTVSSPINATIVGDDVLGTMLTGKRNSQLEIPFYTVPTSTFLTTTLTNATAVASAGHTVYQLSASAGSALAKAVSVQTVTYRPGHEIYTMFTAAFINAVGGTISHRIGIYDVSDGFFIGIDSTNLCIGKRTGGVESTVLQGSFNVDNLLGTTGSKFTRNGVPEPINYGVSNLYRIRFAWLGSGNIYFEVFSPDGEWVLFHNIQQPNSSFLPSLTNPNLPMTLEVSRPSGTTVAGLATACWAAGTTSDLQPITSTLTDQTLATLNRSVITGVTTGGGGGYVNVKVNPSGALTVDSTVSSSVLPTGASTSALQTTGNTSLSSILTNQTNGTQQSKITDGTNVSAVKAGSIVPLATDPALVVSLSPNSSTGSLATSALQTTGNSTLSTISGKLPAALGTQTTANSMAVNIASDQIVPTSLPDLNITGAAAQTASGNNALLAVAGTGATDCNGYRSGFVQVVSTATAGNYVFEASQDNVNFQTMAVINAYNVNGTNISASITATASSLVYAFPITARYIRLRIITGLTGGSIQCYTRLTQTPYQPILLPVGQATASNLNVSASIAASQTLATVTTVTGVTTVSGVTSSNAAVPQAASDIASAAIVSTTTSATFSPLQGVGLNIVIPVTAFSGTNPTMDVDVQFSDDTGTNWFTVYSFPRITGTGVFRSPSLRFTGNRVRYIQTIGGTTPSFTRSIQRLNRSDTCPILYQFIDRTIVPNTLGSTTPAFYCEGATDFNLIVRCTAQTTAATIALEFSLDGTNWFTSGTTVTTVNGIARAAVVNEQWKFVRANVTAGGTGITLDSLTIKGIGI